MSASDGGDDFIGIGGPLEGLGFIIVLGEKPVDGGLKIDDRSEDAALETPLGESREEALHRVEPGGARRGEVECPARMVGKPCAHLRMLMDGVVVENRVNDLADRNFCLDGVEETDELLMAVTLHVAADDRAVEDIEGGEQRRRAMPFVIMRHRTGAALLHRQARLGAVERLDLALLINRQHVA